MGLVYVLLGITEKILQFDNCYELYQHGHTYLLMAMIGFIMLPGIVKFFLGAIEILRCKKNEDFCCFEVLPYNPFTFHIAVWFWHIYHDIHDMCTKSEQSEKEKLEQYSKSHGFQVLQSVCESAPIVLLELVILFVTSDEAQTHFYTKLGLLLTDVVMLSLTCAEHHVFYMSAKTTIPEWEDIIPVSVPYFIICLSRMFTLALLAAYTKIGLMVAIIAHMFFNACAILGVLDTDLAQGFKTWVSSLFTPICFIPKSKLNTHEEDFRKKIFSFYKWNSLIFTLSTIVPMLILTLLLAFDKLTYSCEELPIFSCLYSCPNREIFCLPKNQTKDETKDYHSMVKLLGYILVPLLNIIASLMIYCMNCCTPDMGKLGYRGLHVY